MPEQPDEECEEIDLSPEEEEALEAAWAKLDQQRKSSDTPAVSEAAKIPPPSGS